MSCVTADTSLTVLRKKHTHVQSPSIHIGRHSALHTLAALARYPLEFAKVEHSGPMDRWPLLHTVPIPHGRFPVKATVIGHILQEQPLHLAGDLGPFLDLKRLALFLKELI